MRGILRAPRRGAGVVPWRRAAAGVRPEVTGDIPQIIANQDGGLRGRSCRLFQDSILQSLKF
jgi:hypothetical protein